jgi:hypothetical protein
MKITVFWDVMFNLIEFTAIFEECYANIFSVYSFTLKMKAIWSSKILVNCYHITKWHVPEDGNLHFNIILPSTSHPKLSLSGFLTRILYTLLNSLNFAAGLPHLNLLVLSS